MQQQGIVRDIMHAQNTPEQTVMDMSTFRPKMIEDLADSAEILSKTLKETGKEKDMKPLTNAVSSMVDAFRNADAEMNTARKDLTLQSFYKWAYKSGYTNEDIDPIVKDFGVNDLAEDVTKYRKETARKTEDKTKMMLEAGYKINPGARSDSEAIASYEKQMQTKAVIDSATGMYTMQKDTDPDAAGITLRSLAPTLVSSLGKELSATLEQAGGAANISRQDILDISASYRTALMAKGLPEWYATYVTDLVTMPFKDIAEAKAEDVAKATASVETKQKNIEALVTSGLLLNSVNSVDGPIPVSSIAGIKGVIGSEGAARLIKSDDKLLKNIMTGSYLTPDTIDEKSLTSFQKEAVKNNKALNNLYNNAEGTVKDSLVNLVIAAERKIPDVTRAAVAQGATSNTVANQYNSLPDLSSNAPTPEQMTEIKAEVSNILNANAKEEVRLFGADKIPSLDTNGSLKLLDKEGKEVKTSVKDNSELRRTEKFLHKLSLDTAIDMPQMSRLHNEAALAVRSTEKPVTTAETTEADYLLPTTGDTEIAPAPTKKTPPVPPKKPDEVSSEKAAKVPPVPPKKPAEVSTTEALNELPDLFKGLGDALRKIVQK